ncbi:MAG: HAMP domain-containing sensor histidine kinase [Vicinamibacterales bacterium]
MDVRAVVAMMKDLEHSIPDSWRLSRFAAAPIVVNGALYGVVATPPPSQWSEIGAASAISAALLTLLASLVCVRLIVRPVRVRVQTLQEAASRLGRGDLTARAPVAGSDEITDLSLAFNAMADELTDRAAALETSNRVRRQLVADVSHELMTPLTSIMGLLDTILMPEVHLTEERRQRHLTLARQAAGRIERIVGDLLDVARLEAGAAALAVEQFSIAELFDDVAERHEEELSSRQLVLKAEVRPRTLQLSADSFRIEQAIENLVMNAIRHTPPGGTIELSAFETASAVYIEVRDTGEGVAPEHLPHLFDRFFKAGRNGAMSKGSGLGLSIVKAIVTRHGGQVRACSQLRRGTTITLELPCEVTEAL